jgi:hypothetical protein
MPFYEIQLSKFTIKFHDRKLFLLLEKIHIFVMTEEEADCVYNNSTKK